MKRLILAVVLCAPSFVGCAAKNPSLACPPGQTCTTTITGSASIDLNMARSLLVAQTAIEQAKTLVVTHPAFKTQLNQVIAGYNLAQTSYLTYHAALIGGNNPDPAAIQAQVTDIMTKAQALVASIK